MNFHIFDKFFVSLHQHGVSIQCSINVDETLFRMPDARMSKRADLNLGLVVYLSIVLHIPAS